MRACDYSVWKIWYKTTFAERHSTLGGMDSELTGKYVTEQREYLCVAPDRHFAMVAFKNYHSNDEFLSISEIGKLNDMVFLQ